jgi:hypothetical protein
MLKGEDTGEGGGDHRHHERSGSDTPSRPATPRPCGERAQQPVIDDGLGSCFPELA